MLDRDRFQRLWSRLASGDASPVFDRLADAYSEPHRAYHNATHIRDCLEQFDRAREFAERQDEVEAAIWFHDAVYDPRAKDNEERSADWAASALRNAGAEEEIIHRVLHLILATKHDAEPESPDARLLMDVDLSILGRDPGAFDHYDRAIRREYEWVPEEQYRDGRTGILQRFLDRPRIYITPPFLELETAARNNLKLAIDRLRDR
jgi:predicted metal-dependent HD superfamily phosphohydrolase